MNAPALIIVAMKDPGTVKAFAVRATSAFGPVPRLAEVLRLASANGAPSSTSAPVEQKKPSRWDSLFGSRKSVVATVDPAVDQQQGDLRVSRETALRIETLLRHYHPDSWALAAPENMADGILERLTPTVKQTLAQVVSRDLGKLDAASVMQQFIVTQPS